MLLALTSLAAVAGSGPWVVGEGNTSVYVGGETQRLSRLAITVDGERSVVDVGEGISSFGLKGIVTVGLTPHVELEGVLPWWRVQANRPDATLCGDIGLGACRTTTTVGVLEFRAKVLLLDELFGAPLSLAIGPEVRAGDFTLNTRERLTNAGEGGLDTGGFVSIGRTGSLRRGGYWSGFLDLLGRYRFPNTRTFPGLEGTLAVPGPEVGANAEYVIGNRRVVVGPVATVLWRITGRDWGDIDLTDPDRFAALRVFNARVGATAVVRGAKSFSASLTVLRTVAARNNPSDVFSISAGLQTLVQRRRDDG
ncbi:MAG: hypothetical protein AAF602_16570 [Myxococcota bacterium]